MSLVPKERRPWSMKWIVAAIVVFLVPYTYLTLHFRKPGKAFEPYADIKDRANTLRLLSAGYQRIALDAQRPALPSNGGTAAPTSTTAGGVPAGLRATLVDAPLLPAEILTVNAAPATNASVPYPIQFTCTLPDNKEQLAGAALYLHGEEVVITPDFEKLSGDLQTRTRENIILVTVPAGALKPGHYRVTLAGEHASRVWSLQVK
jgi:hypothetical protein